MNLTFELPRQKRDSKPNARSRQSCWLNDEGPGRKPMVAWPQRTTRLAVGAGPEPIQERAASRGKRFSLFLVRPCKP